MAAAVCTAYNSSFITHITNDAMQFAMLTTLNKTAHPMPRDPGQVTANDIFKNNN